MSKQVYLHGKYGSINRKYCATLEEAIEYKKEVLKIIGRDE